MYQQIKLHHFAVHQKGTKHYKSALLQLNKKKFCARKNTIKNVKRGLLW